MEWFGEIRDRVAVTLLSWGIGLVLKRVGPGSKDQRENQALLKRVKENGGVARVTFRDGRATRVVFEVQVSDGINFGDSLSG